MKAYRIRIWVVVALGIQILLLACLGWQNWRQRSVTDERINRIIDGRWKKVQLAQEIFRRSSENNRTLLELFLTKTPAQAEKLLAARDATRLEITALFNQLEPLVQSEQGQSLFKTVVEKRVLYVKAYEEIIQWKQDPSWQHDAQVLLTTDVMPKLRSYHNALQAFVDFQNQQMVKEGEMATRSDQRANYHGLELLLGLVGMIIGIGFFIVIRFSKHETEILRSKQLLQEAHDLLEIKVAERTAELEKSEEKFRSLFTHAEVGMFRSRFDGSEVLELNEKYLSILGKTREECVGKPSQILWADPKARDAMVQTLKTMGRVDNLECRILRKNGQVRTCLTSVRLYPEQEILEGSILDITEQKQATEALLEAETHFQTIVENINVGIYRSTGGPDGHFLRVNSAHARILGYDLQEFMQMKVADLYVDRVARQQFVDEIMKTGSVKNRDLKLKKKDGTQIWGRISVVAKFDEQGNLKWMDGVIEDVTVEKQREVFLKAEQKILQILNQTEDLKDSVQPIIAAFKEEVGFDAVGIRLQEGDDFPYLGQQGFSEDFLRTENSLVARDDGGLSCRDKDGNVKLECTCGLVISGKMELPHPLFTSGGSFWTNNSSPLLELPPDQDPRFHPRNICIHKGYASVALVPIRNRDKIVGLLQLNDHRTGRFTKEVLGHLEGIAAHIGEALMRKQTETKLRENELRYRQLFEKSLEGVLIVDVDTKLFVEANPSMCQMLGYTQEEMKTISVANIHPKEALPKIFAGFAAAASGELQGDVALPCLRKDGTVILTELSATNLVLAGRKYNMAVFRDVTERQRMQALLAESESRLRAITDSAHDAILMMNPSGGIEYWNPAAERIFGYTEKEAIGQNLHSFLAPACYHEKHQAAFPKFLETGQGEAVGKTLDLKALQKDGTEFFVQLSLSAIRTEDGWHAVGMIRDITERKRMEMELQQTNRQLEGAMERANEMAAQAEMANIAKSQFLANMSHEIRTPMNGVIGMTGLLLDTKLDEEQRRYAEVVQNSSELLLTMINDVLDFSKIEAGKLSVETIDFDLLGLLGKFNASMAVLAQKKGIELFCNTASNVPTLLRGDPGRLRQILNNLVGNAIKFTQVGEVTIRVALVEKCAKDLLLRFSVRDTGIGIPEDRKGLLFQKFNQLDASVTRKYGGTGLGLAIAKQLVELMGGEIGVNSEEGKGSEFWFTVRLEQPAETAPSTAAPVAPRSGTQELLNRFANRQARILLAEDNLTNQQVAVAILKKMGLKADVVVNGKEVLKALEAGDYDLVLMDVQMPEMDGLEATRVIRNSESAVRNHKIPVIAMTAHAMEGDRERCIEAGLNDYVAKPVVLQALAEVLDKWLLKEEVTEKQSSTDSVATSSIPVFDRAGVMARLMGDEEMARTVAEGFLEDIPRQIAALRGYLESGNVTAAERQAHTIKGASANVGGEVLRAVAFEMEKAGKAGDLDVVKAQMTELETQFDRFRETITKELQLTTKRNTA